MDRFAVIVAAGMVFPASAAPQFYYDRAEFEAAASGLQFESFESDMSVSESVTYGDLTFTETGGSNAFTYTAKHPRFSSGTTHAKESIWFADNGDSIAVVSVAYQVNALGFDITADTASTVNVGGPFATSFEIGAHAPSFFGVIDLDNAFDSLSLDLSGAPDVGFDSVLYSGRVPAPGSALALGLGGALAVRRRRRG